MFKKYLFVILCLSLFITAGCTEEKKTDIGNNQEPSKADSVMKDFNSLIQKESNVETIAQFISKHISVVTKENASEMVIQLEKVQQKELPQFEKLFTQEGLQQKIADEYRNLINDPSTIKDAEVKELINKTKNSGYRVETAEGFFFPIIDYGFYEKYSTYVTKDLRDYLEIMTLENDKVPAKDAALVIGWDEVIKRALNQEKFINNYPSSVKLQEVKQLYQRYLSFTLYGLNNTPLFSYDNKVMVPEAKEAYLAATRDIGNSKYLQTVIEYLEVIKKNNYTLTKEVEQHRDKVSKDIAQ